MKREQKLSTPRAICQFHKAGIALSEQTFILRSAASSMLNWLVNYGVDSKQLVSLNFDCEPKKIMWLYKKNSKSFIPVDILYEVLIF